MPITRSSAAQQIVTPPTPYPATRARVTSLGAKLALPTSPATPARAQRLNKNPRAPLTPDTPARAVSGRSKAQAGPSASGPLQNKSKPRMGNESSGPLDSSETVTATASHSLYLSSVPLANAPSPSNRIIPPRIIPPTWMESAEQKEGNQAFTQTMSQIVLGYSDQEWEDDARRALGMDPRQ